MSPVLHVVASINPAVGGPAQSVPNLLETLPEQHISVRLLCLNYEEHGPLPLLSPKILTAIRPNILTRPLRGWSPSLALAIEREAHRASIVHNHGLWMFPNHYAARSAARKQKPYIVSPRGMLGSWALANSAFKKRLVWHLHEHSDLNSAFAFHATSGQEADAIRLAGFTQPIAVIPNGINPTSPHPSCKKIIEKSFPELKGKRLALFMSRIHPKKGLLELVEAWSRLPEENQKDWLLLLVGPDLSNYRPVIEAAIRSTGMGKRIYLHPPVSGSLKESLLEHAELFILPSHEENFGIVVAEALAHGTPVITTHGTPWEILNHNKCGWWIPMSVDSLRQTLATALLLPPPALATMGLAGKDYASLELSWSVIAQKMSLFYAWILSGGPPPSFVRTD